jgi:ribosomal protein S18 acetylase RimI-like enzyme
MPDLFIRSLTFDDIPRLSEIDAEFESNSFLDVEKTVDGLQVAWRLVERPLDPPFRSSDYGLNRQQREEVGVRLREGDGLYLAVEDSHTGKLVALLDVERERWRDTATIWNILVDRGYRRRGLGRELLNRAFVWAREQGLRGVVLETQTNNLAACRFYRAMGFKLCGLDDHFYSNDDIGVKEVAIFWWYELFPLLPQGGRRGQGMRG